MKNIVKQLKSARERLGLSQRALGERVGLPQSHISRIEQGKVDLQTSSLVQLSRALEMECMLVPRQLIKAVQGMQHGRGVGKPKYAIDENDIDKDGEFSEQSGDRAYKLPF